MLKFMLSLDGMTADQLEAKALDMLVEWRGTEARNEPAYVCAAARRAWEFVQSAAHVARRRAARATAC